MRRFWKITGIATVVAVVAVMALGAVVLAQDTEDGDSWPIQFRDRLHEAIAGILGITVDEYDSAVDTARGQVLDEAVTEGWMTQDQADRMLERAEEGYLEGFGRGMRPGGHGRGGMMDLEGGLRGFDATHSTLLTIAAEQLGTTVEDLVTQLEDGNTIAGLADAQGVDTQDIADAYLANYADKLDEAVANQRITQEQADSMLEEAAVSVQERMEAAWPDCLSHPDGMMDLDGGSRGFDATHSTLLTIAAEQLGTTVEDLVTQLEDGNTIAGLADAQGVDTQDIADAYLANYADKLDEAVANQRITQEQADSMLEEAAVSVQERMEAAWPDCLSHPDGMRDGFMPGGRHGFEDGIEDGAEVEGTSS